MVEISIIVPVYNVEKYLSRCIDSILIQTFTNFELILVEDGSPDRCGEICDEYAKRDSRIKVIHKINGGVSSARNEGIKISSGRYIQFIDSDDYIDEDLLEEALKRIEEDESDIVFWGFYNEYLNKEVYKNKYYEESIITDEIKKYSVNLYKKDLFGYTWCKLFKSSVIKDNNIRFNEKLKFCEDEEFTCNYCSYTRKISIINKCKYHYINYEGNRETLTQKKNKDELLNRNLLFIAWEKLLGDEYREYLLNKAYLNLRFIFFNVIWSDLNKDSKNNEIENIKKTYMYNYFKNNRVAFKHKVLSYFINVNNVILFKIFNRLAMILNMNI